MLELKIREIINHTEAPIKLVTATNFVYKTTLKSANIRIELYYNHIMV